MIVEDEDYKFGIEGEVIFQKYMKKKHKINIYKLDKYHFSDFIDYAGIDKNLENV